MILGDHPGLENAEEQGCADTAANPAGAQDEQVITEHGKAGQSVETAV